MKFDLLNIWILGGIALLIAEMLTGGFFLMFIAIGAFAAALIASFTGPFAAQAIVASGVAVAGVIFLRKPIQKRLHEEGPVIANDIGKEITVDQAILPHKQARITYQGTSWLTTNIGHEPILINDHVVIVGLDGNTLLVRKLN